MKSLYEVEQELNTVVEFPKKILVFYLTIMKSAVSKSKFFSFPLFEVDPLSLIYPRQ